MWKILDRQGFLLGFLTSEAAVRAVLNCDPDFSAVKACAERKQDWNHSDFIQIIRNENVRFANQYGDEVK